MEDTFNNFDQAVDGKYTAIVNELHEDGWLPGILNNLAMELENQYSLCDIDGQVS